MTKIPRLLPQPNIRWGGYPYNRDPIEDMCDYGARSYMAGECDLVNFDCAPGEDVAIRKYMSEAHPGVPIAFGDPRKTLEAATNAWRETIAMSIHI